MTTLFQFVVMIIILVYELFQSFCCFGLFWNWIGFKLNYGGVKLIVISAAFIRVSHVGFVIDVVMLKLAYLLVVFAEC